NCRGTEVCVWQKGVDPKPGAVLPGDVKIKQVNLRGVESSGMICSLQELGIDEQYIPKEMADGIFVFSEDVKVGEDVASLLNLNDAIVEFGLTPNRADSLSMLGVAYEVAAILDTSIQLPADHIEPIKEKSKEVSSVTVEDERQTSS